MRTVSARERIAGAEIIENRAANPAHGERGEGQATIDVEAVHRLQQSDRAGGDQFLERDRIAHARSHLAGGMVHQPEITAQQVPAVAS